uniref:purine nucleoside phosphorylase LACC1-like n=1 Tax=Centroberyx gerrardi TaxID=166262 RepID=UPI003AABEC16
MFEVLLVDLIHGRCPACSSKSLDQLVANVFPLTDKDADTHIFLLCGQRCQQANGSGFSNAFRNSRRRVHILDFRTVAECLYRFKQTVDELDLSSVGVLTSPQGREVLLLYQKPLFTPVYSFEYVVKSEDGLTCPSCSPAHTDSPGERVDEEVRAFLQQLPALKGDVAVLKSTLIP